MWMTTARSLVSNAHHEAAHAVVALECGLGVEYSQTCRPKGHRFYEGMTRVLFPPLERYQWAADAYAVMLFAGEIAEATCLEGLGVWRARYWAARAARRDHREWDEVAGLSSLTADEAAAAAFEVLDASWGRVEDAAHLLARDLRLAGSDI